MAFDSKKLTRLDFVDVEAGVPILVYKGGADNLAAITAANYFNPAADRMPVGTLLLILASDSVAWRRVSANNGTTVTISALG